MNAETILLILRLLDLVATAAIRSTAVSAEFSSLREQIKTMVEQGRDPTSAEWIFLNDRADALHQELQGQSEET